MTGFVKENWSNLLLLAFFVLLATQPVTRWAGLYLGACVCLGFLLYRKQDPARGPRRWRAGGRLLQVVGPALGLLVIAQVLWDAPFNVGLAISVFVGLGALGLHHWGGLLSLPDAHEVMKRDPRPPVVFLRSFKEEERQVHSTPVGERDGGEAVTDHSFPASREQEMAQALDRIGPFVAIGRPGEPLATLGAARVYLGDGDWKAFVEAMVPCSAAIVLQPEFTPGTLWEVGLVVKAVDLRRLLLVVPDPAVRPFRYARVRGLVSETFGVSLPEADACGSCEAFYFDRGRRPVALRLSPPSALDPFVAHVNGLGPPRGVS
ncbi:MAG: hypothetical protein HY928_16745 [Elusimicrobia bacterium]|nr:hypothetical protein [Elusimicrobiota bacterium]